MRIVRVLVYTCPPSLDDHLRGFLRNRTVIESRDYGEISVAEAFVQDHGEVRAWLGEPAGDATPQWIRTFQTGGGVLPDPRPATVTADTPVTETDRPPRPSTPPSPVVSIRLTLTEWDALRRRLWPPDGLYPPGLILGHHPSGQGTRFEWDGILFDVGTEPVPPPPAAPSAEGPADTLHVPDLPFPLRHETMPFLSRQEVIDLAQQEIARVRAEAIRTSTARIAVDHDRAFRAFAVARDFDEVVADAVRRRAIDTSTNPDDLERAQREMDRLAEQGALPLPDPDEDGKDGKGDPDGH
jgi:hypothetical protein